MKKVFFYGDSNTYGYDPSGMMGGRYPMSSRWTTILADSLEGEWIVAHDGMPGRMIPDAGRGLNYVIDSLKSEMPMDLFAVMLGTNDLLTMRKPDASKVAAKMDNLVRAAKDVLSSDILLIVPMQIRFTDPSCTDPFVRGSWRRAGFWPGTTGRSRSGGVFSLRTPLRGSRSCLLTVYI